MPTTYIPATQVVTCMYVRLCIFYSHYNIVRIMWPDMYTQLSNKYSSNRYGICTIYSASLHMHGNAHIIVDYLTVSGV